MDGRNHFVEGQKWVRRNIANALGDDDFEEMHHEFQEEDDPSEPKFELIRQSSGELKNSINSILKKGIHAGEISDREEHFGEEELSRNPKGGFPVLDDELQKLYDLYEEFKDNSDCCQHIAGELDPTGNISAMEISKTLKQLGFKVPAKKKMQNSGALDKLKHSSSRDLPRNAMQPNLSITNTSSSLGKPIHSRKRVQTFSVDQEQKIKELFEQFKDHRRCNCIIANELDGMGYISAAQVSRKLKQLGLVLHKPKRSDTNFHLRDEGSNDISSKSAGDVTLSSLRNRSKHKPNGNHNERKKQKIAIKSSEGMMDDESLSSILVKKKKISPESEEEELMADTTKKNADENDFQFRDIQVSERDEVDAKNIKYSSDSESETMRLDSPNASEIKISKILTLHRIHFDDQLVDELVNFDEDTDSISTPKDKRNVVRRQARMVIDFEDDD